MCFDDHCIWCVIVDLDVLRSLNQSSLRNNLMDLDVLEELAYWIMDI